MQLYRLDPLSDHRWCDFVASHPRASVFHQTGWLNALALTYNYRPVALTSAPPGEKLRDGLIFCEIRSSITGNRLVSLPFSDHAEPLLNDDGVSYEMAKWIQAESNERNWKYVEIRPITGPLQAQRPMVQSQSFWLHTLDLTLSTDRLFHNLHRSCVQRRIRHAERQKLIYERSSSTALLDEFYDLLIKTRRRFQLLPQPRAWFRNLMACAGTNAEIRIARKDGEAIAAILTLRHGGSVVYKYGCSDEKFHHLAGMPYLFWRLIEESKGENAVEIDFGRSDFDNHGLIRFKDRLGSVRRRLNYFRSAESSHERALSSQNLSATRALFSALPDTLSSMAGSLVYRHIG
jgi:CelD/BcsL family acetyltransferase involved in cellulose biosynthesis